MLSHIDQEILTEILKRLPVKLLVQLRCVSKTWNSLISSQNFISTYTKYTLNNHKTNKKFLLRHYSWPNKHEKYTIFHPDEVTGDGSNGSENQEYFFHCKSYSQYFEIVGSCHGLLCLSDTYRINSHNIILWNPTIRKSVTLPRPLITLEGIYMFVLGFGFNSRTNNYKVVRVVYPMNGHECKEVIVPEVEVYELSTMAWRGIRFNVAPKHVISELSLQVFLNGAVHWIGYNPTRAEGDFRDLGIVAFDLGEEEFFEMRLPDSVSRLSALDLSVGVCASGKLLSLVQYDRPTRSQWIQYGSCCVWVMKEYGVIESWTKQCAVNLDDGVGKVLGIQKEREVLIVRCDGELVSYDLQTQEINLLGIQGIPNSFYLDVHYDTLVLL